MSGQFLMGLFLVVVVPVVALLVVVSTLPTGLFVYETTDFKAFYCDDADGILSSLSVSVSEMAPMCFVSSMQLVPQSTSEHNLLYSPTPSAASSMASMSPAKHANCVWNGREMVMIKLDPDAQPESLNPFFSEESNATWTSTESPYSCVAQEYASPPVRESSPVARPRRGKASPTYAAALRAFDDMSTFTKVPLGEFERKALNSLIKRLRNRPSMFDNIRSALNQQSPHTPCVIFPRTRDGRMQIGARKCRPVEVYVQLFRFPENVLEDFFCVQECQWSDPSSKMVCVNPYHYERYSDVGLTPPERKHRSEPPPPAPQLVDLESAEHDSNEQEPMVEEHFIKKESSPVEYFTYAPVDPWFPYSTDSQLIAYPSFQCFEAEKQTFEDPKEYVVPYDAEAIIDSAIVNQYGHVDYPYEPPEDDSDYLLSTMWDFVQPI
uniref:MH1 domain-containing protein n=1 Tax=Steinernema glaseri TaxID=37863 RepID=A0A1I8AC37_9BILA